jgi:hypothetical protein
MISWPGRLPRICGINSSAKGAGCLRLPCRCSRLSPKKAPSRASAAFIAGWLRIRRSAERLTLPSGDQRIERNEKVEIEALEAHPEKRLGIRTAWVLLCIMTILRDGWFRADRDQSDGETEAWQSTGAHAWPPRPGITLRAWRIAAALDKLKHAMEDGVPVKGYLHGSLIDNFEWVFGDCPSSEHLAQLAA